MANMFDENGNYNKTEWKPGDRITAGKLNKIEDALEAINNNDIERHKEADERLDALEEQNEAIEERFDELEDLVADNKSEVEVLIYENNVKMDRLEQEMNDGIDTVEAIAHTVDDKIADADDSMKAQVNQGKADMEAMVAEVEEDLEGLHAKDAEFDTQLNIITNTITRNVRNTEGFINKIFEVCQTYTDNFDKLVYGNIYTAWDDVVKTVDGKYELDCSSFINLLIHGVRFEKSRYCGLDDNQGDPLFFQDIDSYEYRLANQIAKYCVENGYAYIPSSIDDIRPGDIVFYSWSGYDENPEEYTQAQIDFHNNAFMKIDHVAMYLDKKNDTYHHTIQFEQYTPQFLFTVTEGYMEQAVLAARLPFANIQENDTRDLLIGGDVEKICENSIEVGTYYLCKKLEKGKMYSLIIDGVLETDSCYFVVHDLNGNVIYSDYGDTSNHDKTIMCHFLYQGDGVDGIKILIGSSNTSNTSRNGRVRWCSLYEGYKITIPTKQGNSISNVRNIEITTGIQNMFLVDHTQIYNLIEYDTHYIFNIDICINTDYKSDGIPIGRVYGINMTQTLPCTLLSYNNTLTNGVLEFNKDNEYILVKKFNTEATWRRVIATGMIIK